MHWTPLGLHPEDAMPPTTAARTDNDITDEATGRARVELAAASKARSRAAAQLLAEQNAKLRQQNATVEQRTDDDITDEAAGKRRIELAAASKARREAEAKALAQRNAEMRERRQQAANAPRTDDDITDEVSVNAAPLMRNAYRLSTSDTCHLCDRLQGVDASSSQPPPRHAERLRHERWSSETRSCASGVRMLGRATTMTSLMRRPVADESNWLPPPGRAAKRKRACWPKAMLKCEGESKA